MRLIFKLLLVGLCVAGSAASAQVTEAHLTAEGSGMTRDEAIATALASAAGQAFGIQLNATTISKTLGTEVITNDEADTLMVSAVNRVVTQAVNAPVNNSILGYSIDSLTQGIADTWDATVTLRYAKFERLGADSDRRSIIVVTNEKRYQTLLTNTVTEALTASRRFDVLNRRNDSLFDAEKAFIQSDDAATAEVARLSQAGGADYLLVADLQGLSIRNNMQETIRMTGEVLVRSAVNGTLRLEVVEFASRKVKWSGTQKFGATLEGASSIGNRTLSRLIQEASNKLMDNLVASIYPIRVVKVVGDVAIINRGEGSATVGDTYAVFLMGDELIDPQSGESLGSLEIEAGVGTVTEVKPKFAFLKMANATLDPNADYIVRKADKRPPTAKPKPRPRQRTQSAPAAPSRKDTFLNN